MIIGYIHGEDIDPAHFSREAVSLTGSQCIDPIVSRLDFWYCRKSVLDSFSDDVTQSSFHEFRND